MIPTPSVYVNGVLQDGHEILVPFKISHGRSEVDSQADAPQLTIEWWDIEHAPIQGDEIRVVANLGSGESPPTYDDPNVFYDDARVTYDGQWLTAYARFTGIVTDVKVPEYAGIPGNVEIVAIDRQADLGRVDIAIDRPIENDIARVNAIAAAAGVTIEIHGNPGANLSAGLIENNALAAIHDTCYSSGGMLWSDGEGVLHYGTGDHRTIVPPLYVIPGYVILSGLEWFSSVSDIINRVDLEFGPEGARGTFRMEDAASLAEFGVHYKKVSTTLQTQADANQLGALILSRRSFPFSTISDIMFDSDYNTGEPSAFNPVMQVRVSDSVYLPIPPDPAPAGLLAEWIVEGWQEEWVTPNQVTIQMAVSDRIRFALTVLRLWSDALPNSWQGELDRGSWLDALVKGPEGK